MDQLSYKQLQKLAKKYGIPMNLKKDKMLRLVSAASNEQKESVDSKETSDEEIESVVMTTEDSVSTSKQFLIPKYWGSPLEGCSSAEELSQALEEYFGGSLRTVSLGMVQEPFLAALCRKNGIGFLQEDVVDQLRDTMQKCVQEMLLQATTLSPTSTAAVLDQTLAARVCEKMGIPVMGASIVHTFADPLVEDLTDYKESTKKSLEVVQGKFWDAFITTVLAPHRQVKELGVSLVLMRRLIEANRATIQDVTVATTVGFICHKLDDDTFRYMMGFLLGGNISTFVKGRKLMFEDIDDNWSNINYETIEEAQADGVDVLTAEDDHTGVNFLHRQTIYDHADSCQKLIEMGMDPNKALGDYFENGDGWGELEYTGFTPMNFAACNGRVDCAKVLLKNGASAECSGGWDGGYHLPLFKHKVGGDYWYTSSNSPLHQAARGNHPGIIHLILNGPDAESLKYAGAENILASTWQANIENSKPNVEMYDETGMNEEDVSLTPLGMAFLFGNFEAAEALILHGAKVPTLGKSNGYARRLILDLLFKEVKFANILEKMRSAGHEELVKDFLATTEVVDEEESDDDDDEEEDMEYEVFDGDVRVPNADDPEDKSLFSPLEGLAFGSALCSCLEMVHPNHQLTRNSQHVFNDYTSLLIKRACNYLSSKSLSFTKETVKDYIANDLFPVENELGKYCQSEIEKATSEKLSHFYPVLVAYLLKNFPELCSEKESDEWKEGVLNMSAVCDYMCCELLELSGNASRDMSKQTIGVAHICGAISNDIEFQESFKSWCFGYLPPKWAYGDALKFAQKIIDVEEDVIAKEGAHLEWLRKEQKAANGVKSEGNLIYDEMKFFLRRKTVIHDRYKATTSFPIEKFKILLDDWLKQANMTSTVEGVLILRLALEQYLSHVLRMTETFMGERIANMKDDEEEEEEEKEVDNEKAEDEKPANALSKTMAVTVADFEIGLSKHSLKL